VDGTLGRSNSRSVKWIIACEGEEKKFWRFRISEFGISEVLRTSDRDTSGVEEENGEYPKS
jgi:hypothetical protein